MQLTAVSDHYRFCLLNSFVLSQMPTLEKDSDNCQSDTCQTVVGTGNEFTDIPGIANALDQTFSDDSSSEQYTTKFESFRCPAECQPLNFNSNNYET